MGLTREQLFKTLNVIKDGPIDLEAITKKAMVNYEDKAWRENLENAPHGHPWFTSFHASSFPGGDKSCGRKLLYTLMDIPNVDPFPIKLRGQAEMGKAAEAFVISRWKEEGLILEEQSKFEDEETWLTGSSDALLGIENLPVLPVDLKSKDHEVIKAMQLGTRTYLEKDYLQLQAYLYLARKFHRWERDEAESGILYYVSRQDPTFVKEYFFPINNELIDNAVAFLKQCRRDYLNGVLPERPKEWKWTEEPCKWCPFKREACKKDWKEGTTELDKSNGIEFAKFIRPDYDYSEKRQEVLKRWN